MMRQDSNPPAGQRRDEPHMVGTSDAIRDLFATIRKFARTNAPVLITGESGTGKELAAQAIHERSDYAKGPFVPINCGGLPPDLVASELFGYEKGAFTGASKRKLGRIEAAAGGTVFLDEIGDLPLELQPHLLRFLQEKTIDRVGGNRPTPIDVRVIAATNVDLHQSVKEGKFREDLFYRLDVLTVNLPPLRKRGEDIDLLIRFFLNKFGEEMGQPHVTIDECLMKALHRYSWPGNVRELISRIRRGVIMAEDGIIRAEDLGLPDLARTDSRAAADAPTHEEGGPADVPVPGVINGHNVAESAKLGNVRLKEAVAAYESILVKRALKDCHNNIKKAAAQLGVSRVTLYRLIEKHGIESRRNND